MQKILYLGWLLIACGLLILFNVMLSAQTHPCDQPQQTSFSVNAGPVVFSACWDDKDASGAQASATQWGLIDNSLPRTVIPMTKVTQTPNAAGLFQYSTTLTLSKGNHQLLADVCIDDGTGTNVCAAVSSPLVGKAKGPGPKPPVKQSVN